MACRRLGAKNAAAPFGQVEIDLQNVSLGPELVEAEREIGSLEASQSALRQESDAAHDELSAHVDCALADTRLQCCERVVAETQVSIDGERIAIEIERPAGRRIRAVSLLASRRAPGPAVKCW